MGFYLSQYEFRLFGKQLHFENLQTNYKLHQNIYSDFTIGSGNINTIINATKNNNGQYVIVTDLNPTFKTNSDFYEFNTGILFGAKLTTDIYSATVYSTSNKTYSPEINLLRSDRSQLVISHIDKTKQLFPFADGIDVINLKNIAYNVWSKKKVSTLWSLLFYPFNPKVSLLRLYRDPDYELELFDKISQQKKSSMYLSTEATAKAVPIAHWLIKFPGYSNVMSIASERILLNSEVTFDMDKDQKIVLTALKNGSHYISIDTLGDSKGFEIYGYSSTNKIYCFMGQSCPLNSEMKLYYHLPLEPLSQFKVILYKNGQIFDTKTTTSGDFTINQKGVFRVQVKLNTALPFPDNNKWLTWIFTNNFYFN